MSALASRWSEFKGTIGMLYAGWLPFTKLRVEPADLHGRTALVTGANVGIGYECALKLAQYGASVWILCRNAARAEAARATLAETSGNENITVAVVDFGSLASVENFTKAWDAHRPIDIIINNAGLVSGQYLKTGDGHEITYQTNFLTHVLLTLRLLPHLADHARIVNVSSHGHYSATPAFLDVRDMDLDALLTEQKKVREGDDMPPSLSMDLYAKSKALQVIFGRQLQQRLAVSPIYAKKNIIINSCHPGLVASTIWERPTTSSSGVARFLAFLKWFAFTFGVSCEQGACTPVFLATSPTVATNGGGYWDRMSKRTPGIITLDDDRGDLLWDAVMGTGALEGLSKGLEKRQ